MARQLAHHLVGGLDCRTHGNRRPVEVGPASVHRDAQLDQDRLQATTHARPERIEQVAQPWSVARLAHRDRPPQGRSVLGAEVERDVGVAEQVDRADGGGCVGMRLRKSVVQIERHERRSPVGQLELPDRAGNGAVDPHVVVR